MRRTLATTLALTTAAALAPLAAGGAAAVPIAGTDQAAEELSAISLVEERAQDLLLVEERAQRASRNHGPDTQREVMFVGNNWEGTADVIDARTFEKIKRINIIPDRD